MEVLAERQSVLLAGFLAVATLAGCATTLNVTYYSDPPGAVLYEGQTRIGYTPQTLTYKLSSEDRKRGMVMLRGTKVLWASGASAEIPQITADFRQHGRNQQFTFLRPDGVPGREIDVRFALELERLEIMRRQASAQERQAEAQRRQAEAQRRQAEALEAQLFRSQIPSRTNCTSTINGNSIYTSCQ